MHLSDLRARMKSIFLGAPNSKRWTLKKKKKLKNITRPESILEALTLKEVCFLIFMFVVMNNPLISSKKRKFNEISGHDIREA